MKEKNRNVSIIGDKLKLDVTEKRQRGGSSCKGRNSRKTHQEESVSRKDTPRTSQVCIQERHSIKTHQEPVRSVSRKDSIKTHQEESVSFVFMGVCDCYPRTHVLCLLAALIINIILTYTHLSSDIPPHIDINIPAGKNARARSHTHTFS